MSYARKIVRGAIAIFILSVLSGFVGYLTRIIYARNLTIEEYGLFYAVLSLVGLIAGFKDMGLSSAMMRYIPEFIVQKKNELIKKSIITVVLLQTLFLLITTTVTFFLSDYLAIHYFHNPSAGIIIRILGFGLLFAVLYDTLSSIFHGFQEMFYASFLNFCKMLVILISSVIGFYFGLGIMSPTIAYIIYPIIIFLVFFPIFLKIFPQFTRINGKPDKATAKKLFKFGLPVFIGSLGSIILGYTDTLTLTYFSGAKEVGVYNVVMPTSMLVTYFSGAIVGVFSPILIELWVKKDLKLMEYSIIKIYKYILCIIIPVAFMIASFPDLIIKTLFGAIYPNQALTLQILSIGVIFFGLSMLNFQIINAFEKPILTTKVVYITALFNFILNILLIPRYGIIGAAIPTLISYIIMMIMSLYFVKKEITLRFPVKKYFLIIINGIIFISIIYLLKNALTTNIWLESIISVGVACAIYAFLTFFMKIITIDEIKEIMNSIKT